MIIMIIMIKIIICGSAKRRCVCVCVCVCVVVVGSSRRRSHLLQVLLQVLLFFDFSFLSSFNNVVGGVEPVKEMRCERDGLAGGLCGFAFDADGLANGLEDGAGGAVVLLVVLLVAVVAVLAVLAVAARAVAWCRMAGASARRTSMKARVVRSRA
jgi:hypothetical protein